MFTNPIQFKKPLMCKYLLMLALMTSNVAFAQTCSKKADSPAAPAIVTFAFDRSIYDIKSLPVSADTAIAEATVQADNVVTLSCTSAPVPYGLSGGNPSPRESSHGKGIMLTAVAGVGVQLVGASASAGSRGGVAQYPFMSTNTREPNTGDGTSSTSTNPASYKLIFYKISDETTGTDTISGLTLFFEVFGTNRTRLLQVSLSKAIRFIRADTATATCTPTVLPGNTIALPKVSVSALAANGQKAGRTPFSIRLDNCKTNGVQSNGMNVRTFFDGPRVNTTTGNLDVTGAANVQLQLSNGDDTVINLAGAKGSQNAATTQILAGTATMPYAVRYVATGRAGSGAVSSTVNFTIEFP